jgi:DUF1009 family protein
VQPLSLETEKKTTVPAVAIPADPRLAQLEASFKARHETAAQKPFLAAVAVLNKSYVANGITRARAAAQDADAIAALDAEKAAIEKGGAVPAEDAEGTPESLKALRTRADKIKEAQEMQELRERIATQK